MSILVPLYIYPARGAWDQLYKAVERHLSKCFIIVINPASGPGSSKLPDSNWTREILKLNKCTNVVTIGYITVSYGTRPLDEVKRDIDHYAEWADGGLMLQGLFVDEAPSRADERGERCVRSIEKTVRESPVLRSGRIVLNPGTIVDRRLITHADQTVLSEERYETYVDRQLERSFSGLSDPDSLACIIHSIPEDLSIAELKPIIRRLKETVGTLFLTDLSTDYYHAFSPRFAEFVDLVVGVE